MSTIDRRFYRYDYHQLAEDIVSLIHNNRRGGWVAQAEVARVENALIQGPYMQHWPQERENERNGVLPRPAPLPSLPRLLETPSLPRVLPLPTLPRPLAPPALPRVLAPLPKR